MKKNSREGMRMNVSTGRSGRLSRWLWVGSAAVLACWWATAWPLAAQTPPAPADDEPIERTVQAAPAGDAKPGEGLGQPRAASRLDALAPLPPPLGTTPRTGEAAKGKLERYVQSMVDPETTLELVSDHTRLLVLKQAPRRVQVANESVAGYIILSPREISVIGRNVGVTVLTLWFADPGDPNKLETLTYHVRVLPDPEIKDRIELVLRALAEEVNRTFPDSRICLELVGDKVVVTGQARDVAEAAKIMQLIRANYADFRRRLNRRPEAAQAPAIRVQTGEGADPVNLDGYADPGMSEYELANSYDVVDQIRITGEQQVMLRVTVAEVNRSAARSIGLNFALLNSSGDPYFASSVGNIALGGQAGFRNGFGFGFGAFGAGNQLGVGRGFISPIPGFSLGLGGFNNLPFALDNGQVNVAVNALRVLNYAKSLAEPNIIALNGQTANFHAGGQFPVPIVTGYTATGLQGVDFVPYGVRLSFTPFITDRDRIRLQVSAEVSSRDLSTGNSNIGGSSIPNLITRNFNTVVEMREGQTFAVAGLVQTNMGADAHHVPLFGDLPLVGRLFSFDRIQSGEQELMILITPVLVHPMECHQVPPVPGSDLFEPGDCEFYLWNRLESRRDYDYRSPVMTDIDRMKMYRRCEQLYMSGPHGYSNCATCPQP